jgi:hypothetical protein
VPREGDARRTGAATGINEFAASIAAHGLINPLTVRPAAEISLAENVVRVVMHPAD